MTYQSKRKGTNMVWQKHQFYVIARSSIQSKPTESEFETEAEALDEAIKLLKQGQIVEFGEEIAVGW